MSDRIKIKLAPIALQVNTGGEPIEDNIIV